METVTQGAESPAAGASRRWFATPGERWTVLALLGLGLVLRLVALAQASGAPYFKDPILDGFVYDAWGQEVAGLRQQTLFTGKVFYQDPLYPHLLGGLYAVFGRDVFLARLAQVLVGVGSCAFLYAIGRRVFGRAAATLALAASAAYKPFLFYDTLILKTFLEVFFMVAAAWALLAARERGLRRWWFGAGLALGVGALARGNFLLLVPALVLWLRVAFPADGWRGAARRWAWIALGALAGVAPATVHNAVAGGEFVLTTAQAGPNFYTGNHPGNQSGRYNPPPFVYGNPLAESRDWRAEAERRAGRTLSAGEVDRCWLREGLAYAWREPLRFLQGLARKFVLYWHAYEYPDQEDMAFMGRFMPILRWPLPAYAIVCPLGLLGAGIAAAEWRRYCLPLLLLAVYAASVMLFFLFARYRLAAVPFLLLFGAHAVVWAWRQIVTERAHRVSLAAAAGIALFVGTSLVGSGGVFGDMEAWGFGTFRPTVAHFNLGKYYMARGRYAEARAEFLTAVELRPDWGRVPDIHVDLATMAIHEAQEADPARDAAARGARLSEARRHLDQALGRVPGHVEAHRALGNWAYVQGDAEAAVVWLEKAVEFQPALADARINLAEIHLAQGRTGRAAAALEAVLGRYPCHPGALVLLGEVAVREGDRQAARRRWAKAVECDPRNVAARRALMNLDSRFAEEFAARKDLAGANAALAQAVAQAEIILQLEPDDPVAGPLVANYRRAVHRRR